MARRGFLSQVPIVTLRLMIATAVASIGAILLTHAGYPAVLDALVLRSYQVLPGLQLWRLLTYAFVSLQGPIQFLFDLLVLYSFGGWFEGVFGPRRYLRFFLASAVGGALLPVLLGLWWPSAAEYPYTGAWAVFEALTVAMGVLQPTATVNFYMVLPVSARQLMYASWGLIGLFAIFDGTVVPLLPALGGIGIGFVLTLGVQGPRRFWLRFQSARLERQLKRRAQHLRVVQGEPPSGSAGSGGKPGKKTYLN